MLPGLEPDGRLVWTYGEAMVPTSRPRRLLVIGSGAIGIEFASFYRNIGAEVTVAEVVDRILPVEDEEIAAFARKSLDKQGIRILTSAKIGTPIRGEDTITVSTEAGGKSETLEFDRVVSAAGIVGNVEDLELEDTAAKVERTNVVIDHFCRTDEPGLYAIGDPAGVPWLAHKASHEGVLCVEKIAGLDMHPDRLDQHHRLHLLPAAYCDAQ